jgi:glycerophosphoryl diester phosphodiesterase
MIRPIILLVILLTTACSTRPSLSEFQPVVLMPSLYNDNQDGFVIIAHRGASAYAPENTLAAVQMAMDQRAEMVEVDILLSKDGVPVLLHDPSLNRTTSGQGLVTDFTLDELKKLDAGSWFSEDFKGETIPTVEELLQLIKGKISVNLEIKTQALTDTLEGGIVQKVVDLVRKHGMEHHVIFSSFDPRAIRQLKEYAPEIPGAILYYAELYGDKHPVDIVRELRADAFNCSWKEIRQDWLDSLHSQNIPVNIYTVNSDTLMHQLLDRGVDGIFTDYPDVLLQVLRSRNPSE